MKKLYVFAFVPLQELVINIVMDVSLNNVIQNKAESNHPLNIKGVAENDTNDNNSVDDIVV